MACLDQPQVEEERQHWYQCIEAMDIFRRGLLSFVKTTVKEIHSRILQTALKDLTLPDGAQCTTCFTHDVIERQTRKTFKTSCQTGGLCDKIRDEIKTRHMYRRPTWENTDSTKWCTDEWQLAKCFMSNKGYEKVTGAENTDFNGIISILINCTTFQSLFDNKLFLPTNMLLELRDVINKEVRHSPEFKVSKDALEHVEDLLMSILIEPKTLKLDQSAQEANDKLLQLQKSGVIITTYEFISYIEDKLTLGLVQIDKIQAEYLRRMKEITNMKEEQRTTANQSEPKQRNEWHGSVSAGQGGVALGGVSTTVYVRDIHVTTQGNPQLTTDRQAELQARLIKCYIDMISAVAVNMLDPSFDAPLKEVYVNPNIKELKRGGRDASDIANRECIRTYKELLSKRKIFLQGEPGMGKTTFLQKLTMDWCKAHDPTVEWDSGKPDMFFTDIETLRRFKFLFFVSLREMNGVQCDMRDVIKNFIGLESIDDTLWDEECLEVGDALDEWKHPNNKDRECKCSSDRNLPFYRKLGNITRIFTSRPWKLALLNISDTTEKKLEITGIDDPLQLTQKVVARLNTLPGHGNRCASEFDSMIQQTDMAKLMNKPVLAMRLIHQWYFKTFVTMATATQCSLYANMIDMLLGQAFNKNKALGVAHNPQPMIQLPPCFQTCENIQDNQRITAKLCELAFNTLLQEDKGSSIIFKEATIAKFLDHDQSKLGFASGILTEKKPIGLNISKHHPCMFLHKTIQEFLAALQIAIIKDDSGELIKTFKRSFEAADYVLDCSQMFLFACGLEPDLAGQMALHITCVVKKEYQRLIDAKLPTNLALLEGANDAILKGQAELLANGHPENPDIQQSIEELLNLGDSL